MFVLILELKPVIPVKLVLAKAGDGDPVKQCAIQNMYYGTKSAFSATLTDWIPVCTGMTGKSSRE